jgi:pimeloyl-ACP methyl ester carboxylesterase
VSTSFLAEPGAPGFVPFRAGSYRALPDKPRVPHDFFELPTRTVTVASDPFGTVDVVLRVVGQGPPLLLVHGLMTTGYSWRYAIPRLRGSFTLYVPDLPGSGRSAKPDATYSAPGYGTFLRELQGVLGIAGCACIGNSLGGYVALHALDQDPNTFEKLLVLHSPGVPQARLWALRAALFIPGVKAALRALVRRDPRRWAFRNVHYWDESLKSTEEAAEYGDPLATPEGAAAFVDILHDGVDPFTMNELQMKLLHDAAAGRRIGERVRLLYARQDPMVPPRVGPRLQQMLAGSTLGWLEEGSHFAHVDVPDVFAAEALAFLGGAGIEGA